MKALIVDDEKHVRESIQLLMDWNRFGITDVFEAENGSQAIHIISQEHPQIIFTDIRMPLSDGMALMEWLKKEDTDAKIIVISGYSDFEYVQHSLRNGAVDYLLKPINPTHLFEAVKRALSQIDQQTKMREDQRKQKRDLEELLSEIERSYFMKILEGTSDSQFTIHEMRDRFPNFMISKPFMLIFLELSLINDKSGKNTDVKWKSIMAQICKSMRIDGFPDLDALPLYSANKHPYIIILASNTQGIEDEIYQKVIEFLDKNFSISCFSRFLVYKELSQETIVSAIRKTQEQIFSENIWIGDSSERNSSNTDKLSVQGLYDVPMKIALRNKNKEQIKKLVEIWVDTAAFQHVSFQKIKILHEEFFINMRKLLIEWELMDNPDAKEFIDNYEGNPMPVLNEEMQISTDLLGMTIARFLYDFTDNLPINTTSEEELFNEIKSFIMLHSAENLSLGQISNLFFYSESFISKKFKYYTGSSYIEYLTKCRMTKAKEMLNNQNISIVDVARSVGYFDEKYFSRVFRKTFHETPKRFQMRAKNN